MYQEITSGERESPCATVVTVEDATNGLTVAVAPCASEPGAKVVEPNEAMPSPESAASRAITSKVLRVGSLCKVNHHS
jgi:hypothetical protein